MAKRKRNRPRAGWWSGLLVALAFVAGFVGYEMGWWTPDTPATGTVSPTASPVVPAATLSPDAAPTGALAAGEVEAVFIDVGQGDSILLTSGSAHVLVDAGDEGMGQVVLAELQRRGIDKLDLVVASHPHADHIGGLDEVLARIPAEQVFLPEVTSNSVSFERLLTVLEDEAIPVHAPTPGETWEREGLRLTFLGPDAAADYDNLNDWSLLLRLDTDYGSLLLTGDAEGPAENDAMDTGLPLQADILKVGHHGSKTSTRQKFLQAVSPQAAVISVGADNDYGHPTQAILDRLAEAGVQVFRTDTQGTVTCRFSPAGMVITTSK